MSKPKLKLTLANAEELVWRWTSKKFTLRVGHYFGKGISIEDLDHDILGYIYRGLKVEVSEEFAAHFAEIISRMKVLSSETFIATFRRAVSNDFDVKRVFWDTKKKFNFTDQGITQTPEEVERITKHIQREFAADLRHEEDMLEQQKSEKSSFGDKPVADVKVHVTTG